MLRALVVDDEPVARTGLAAMVRHDSDFSHVFECGDRDSAVDIIRTERPDVVLLDIQLNPGTGFDVIETVGADAMPPVIFVTAFDRFALTAFDAAAIDYVLKPPSHERLRIALTRAKSRITQASSTAADARLTELAALLRPQTSRPITVHDGERTLLFEPDEIVWIEAADYYARIHARGRAWLIREALDRLEDRLPCPPFFRVHRSAIVNLRFVTELSRESRHRNVVVLRNGSRVAVSAERRSALETWLASKRV